MWALPYIYVHNFLDFKFTRNIVSVIRVADSVNFRFQVKMVTIFWPFKAFEYIYEFLSEKHVLFCSLIKLMYS